MDNKEYAKIIARNLNRIAAERHKTQADLIHDLKLNQRTVSTWFVGTRIPRMDKIDLLCRYFNCSRSEIMEENPSELSETVTIEELKLLRMCRSFTSEARKRRIPTALYPYPKRYSHASAKRICGDCVPRQGIIRSTASSHTNA